MDQNQPGSSERDDWTDTRARLKSKAEEERGKAIGLLKECFFSISPEMRDNSEINMKIESAVNSILNSALAEAINTDMEMTEATMKALCDSHKCNINE